MENVYSFIHWDCPKGTHNVDSIIESKVIYYLEQGGLRV